MGVKDMQGTPAHLETLHSKDGQRRHKSYCDYYRSNDKWCG